MKKPVRRLLVAALALASMPALAQTPATGSVFSQTFFFGDSLTDSGFYRPYLIESAGPGAALVGRFTTNPGQVWSEYLADYYGTDASPAWGLTSSGVVADDGTNYAIGGARVGVDEGAELSLDTQVDAYLASTGGSADPDALYSVWGGANDLFAAAADPAQAQTIVGEAVAAEIGLVSGLQAAGARYVLVANIPDLGITPAFIEQGPAAQAQATALTTAYNDALFQGLAGSGLRVIPLDTFHLLQEISAAPTVYGFSSATAVACPDSSLTCVSAGSGLVFADGVHPSAEAHAIVGEYAVSVLEAPRLMAMLPNAEAMVGRSRAERVAAHADKPAADGINWWSDLRGDFQRYGGGNVYDGAGPTLTFGVDWSRGNLVYGAFAGYGRQQQDWGLNQGSFDQTDLTAGGFLGWYGDTGGWINGQLSWSQLDFDTDRDVHLGPAVRTHSGSTDGENLSAAVSAGWEFGEGALRHGPVASVLAQRIDLDAFAEDAPGLSTSLAYPEQSFDSLIGSLGWQASYAGGADLKPYARVTVDHEFEDAPEEAWAQAQSIPGSAPYAVPGVSFDQDYGTLTFGAHTRLLGLDANIGASATFGQAGGNHATLFVTLGAGF